MAEASIEKLSFRQIDFAYDGGELILDSVDYDFPLNANVWINGDGGSGKSTLIRLLAGVVVARDGSYFVNDLDVSRASFAEFMPYRIKTGYSMDFGGLLSNRTLRENLSLPVHYHSSPQQKENLEWVESLISRFGLTDGANTRPAMVRGAMRRATCVARAFSLRPEFLLLDNPTEGLDPSAVEVLQALIMEGRRDGWLKHVFVATQNEFFVSKLDCLGVKVVGKKVFGDQAMRGVVAA
ncbi:ABC transporter ATP-binding protein [Candidatus Kaiserbacteria bacterium]|nr:MAG: ABC transporter ATP-binding protein [Candidatus Kaiserbacteria bacterium]